MTILCVYHESMPHQPLKALTHVEDIQATLAAAGAGFERWQAEAPLAAGAAEAEVLAAYRSQIDRLKAERGYQAVDVISMDRRHPQRESLREQFLGEHTHSEDEVRFFVAGRGLFTLHIGEYVYNLLCGRNDLISVPAGVPHWFDMGESPEFIAIRLFNNPEGWVAHYTGSDIARQFPRLEDLG